LLRLLALTGCRLAEVAGMVRSELNGDSWTIPGVRTKNHLEHLVPLSPLAREVIDSAPTVEGKPGFLFTTTGTSPVSGFSRVKRRLDVEMQKLARAETGDPEFTIPPFVIHDLRRVISTELHALGIAPHIVEAVLNHVSGFRAGVAGVYNKYAFADEKRDALERWARWIALVIDRELHAKHEQRLGNGNEEARKKAKAVFLEAIAEGGQRWERYITSLASGAENVVELPTGRGRS
jgi:integrase